MQTYGRRAARSAEVVDIGVRRAFVWKASVHMRFERRNKIVGRGAMRLYGGTAS